jgi:hypothetical protein
MTPPKKPDWMEIADNDGGSNNLAPVAKKSHPLLVATAALTLTFGGALIAQTSQSGAGNTQPLSVQATQSAALATSANLPSSVQPTSIKAPSLSKSTIPAIAIPPSMSGGDDDEYEDEDDDEYEDDEDEDDWDDH